MNRPPFGQKQIERICHRRVPPGTDENGNDVICGEPGKVHVIWDIETMRNAYSCLDHAREATEFFEPDAWHLMGDDCGMPGARYFEEENVCRYDGELPVAQATQHETKPKRERVSA